MKWIDWKLCFLFLKNLKNVNYLLVIYIVKISIKY